MLINGRAAPGLALAAILALLVATGRSGPSIAQDRSEKLCLLVGISDYTAGTSARDGWSSLSTTSDITNFKRTLESHFGFSNIAVLADSEATQDGIISGFRTHLISKAKPGASVVFYFTGHGHQVPDEPGGDIEVDGLDEVLVTWTHERDRELPDDQRRERLYMRDDVLSGLLVELGAKMRNASGRISGSITVILDCCHSGTGAKGAAIPKGRPWNDRIDGPRPRGVSETAGGGWDAQDSLPDGVVVISGCESGQYSYMMDRPEEGSALTYNLCARLNDVTARGLSGVSYRDVFEWVRVRVWGARPNQNPQIEGSSDALIFGDGSLRSPSSYLRVTKVGKGTPLTLTLEGGSLAGVTPGSTYEVFPAGFDVGNPSNQVGELTIDAVDLFSASGKFEPLAGKPVNETDLVASRAVLSQLAVQLTPLRVFAPTGAKATRNLSEMPFITTKGVSIDSFDVRISEDERWYQRSTGSRVEVGETEGALSQQLLAEWRWKELSKLSAPLRAPKIDLELVFVPKGSTYAVGEEIQSAERQNSATIPDEHVMVPGDEAVLTARNLSTKELFFTLLYLDLNGGISVFPENAFAQEAFPPDGKRRVLVHLKDVKEPWGTELFKLVGTEWQIDLSGVAVSPTSRPGVKGGRTELHDLIFGLADGRAKGPSLSVGPGQRKWGVDDLLLTSKPKRP